MPHNPRAPPPPPPSPLHRRDSNGTLFAKVDQAGNKDLAYKMTLGPLSTLSLSVSEKSSSLAWNLELSA
jgi:hypothetical protein